MQLADQRAQECRVAAFDAGGDLRDEGLAHGAVLFAHRHAREEGLAFGRRISGGLVLINGHATPHAHRIFECSLPRLSQLARQ